MQFNMQKVTFRGKFWVLSEEYIWVDLPFYGKFLFTFLFLLLSWLVQTWLIDFISIEQTRRTLQLSKSHPVQDYTHYFLFTSLPVSRTLGGVSTWLASHIFLQHLCMTIYVKHISAQPDVNFFYVNFLCTGYNEEFQDWPLLFFPLKARAEGFWENKTCWGRSQSVIPSSMLKNQGWYQYIDFPQVLKHSGLQNFLWVLPRNSLLNACLGHLKVLTILFFL